LQRVIQTNRLKRAKGLLSIGQLWPRLLNLRQLRLRLLSLRLLLRLNRLRLLLSLWWLLRWRSPSRLLLRSPALLVDLVLDLIKEAQRLVARIARLEIVQPLLEALLLLCRLLLGEALLWLLRECLLLLGWRGLLLSRLEGLLLLRESHLGPLLERLLLLWPLLLEGWLLHGFGLGVDDPKLSVAGKGGDCLPAFVQGPHLRNPVAEVPAVQLPTT